MKNGKKIAIISTTILMLLVGGFFLISGKKSVQYGYELTGQTGAITGKNRNSIATGAITSPVSATALAYINTWNGDVKREQGGVISIITTKVQFAEGDSLTTGLNAHAEIIFADNSIVRMNANSKLSFVKLASSGFEVKLNEGDIWARVLKPFYDASFFTISTSDVSAGVQGTSVRMSKTLTGTTSVAVIDSYSQIKGKEGVILRYNNPRRKVWSEQVLKPENEFTYTDSGRTSIIKSFSGKIAFTDSFIRENTKRDLVYINQLTKEHGGNENLMKRLKGELSVTVPRSEEISVFFDEPILQKMALASSGTIQTSPVSDPTDFQISETLMDDIRKDISLTDNRREIAELKEHINTTPVNREEKKKLEESVHEKEQKVDTTIQNLKERQKYMESDNEKKGDTPLSRTISSEQDNTSTPVTKQKESRKNIPTKEQKIEIPLQNNKIEKRKIEENKNSISNNENAGAPSSLATGSLEQGGSSYSTGETTSYSTGEISSSSTGETISHSTTGEGYNTSSTPQSSTPVIIPTKTEEPQKSTKEHSN